jgi:hypothetical protein
MSQFSSKDMYWITVDTNGKTTYHDFMVVCKDEKGN